MNWPAQKKMALGQNTFKIFFYPEYGPCLFDHNTLKKAPQKTLLPYASLDQNFYQQVNWEGLPLTMAFFGKEKEIRLYSLRLNRELFLLKHAPEPKLKAYVQKILDLSPESFPSDYQLITLRENLPDLLSDTSITKHENELLEELQKYIDNYVPTLFERFSNTILEYTSRLIILRIHLLKFLAILPGLDFDRKGKMVKKILCESLRRLLQDSKKSKRLNKLGQESPLPPFLYWSFKLISLVTLLCPAYFLAVLVRKLVRLVGKRFIAGEDIQKAKNSLSLLAKTKRDFTLDQLGEWVVSEKEADQYTQRVLNLIDGLKDTHKKNAASILRAHVSIKVSALCSDFRPHAHTRTYEKIAPRLRQILLRAKENQVFINVDAEHYPYRDLVFETYQRVLLETPELGTYDQTGIVLQAYLKDAHNHFLDILNLAKKRKLTLPIRLVKGAYWDAETVEAKAHNLPSFEFLNKEETDLHFRQLIIRILENYPHVQLCLASHNPADHCFAQAIKYQRFPQHPPIEHQCLHMTYEALSNALVKMNWPTRNYVPIGDLLMGMGYLVRRIMENSVQLGILTQVRSQKKPLPPHKIHLQNLNSLNRDPIQTLTPHFFNTPPLQLYLKDQRDTALSSLEEFKASLGKKYPSNFPLSGCEQKIYSPSNPDQLVGTITFATPGDVQKALELSTHSFDSNALGTPMSRSTILLNAASLLLSKRPYFASLIVYEGGKNILEAYADVDEAIDFLNYYAREKSGAGRGPMAIITPWNFPLAIPTGMVSAALVSGNPVLFKSAEQTPLVAQELTNLLHQAGVPPDALIHLPGPGESVGQALVDSTHITGILFTGSRKVGTHINYLCQQRTFHHKTLGHSLPLKVITEMGGKNAIIVTASSELDETVLGILHSAFSHAGQKCSALSRIIVDNSIKERLVHRLKEACLDLEVSKSDDPACAINPLISPEDKKRLQKQAQEAIAEAKSCHGKVIVDRTQESFPGNALGPLLIELPPAATFKPESYAQKELFGPIVHLIGFNNHEEALQLFNNTPYGLTGGIFAQSQDDIDSLTPHMEVGNIYVNRPITGARVGVEPFGGFKMSGTGPKAGGIHYLKSLKLPDQLSPKTLGENIPPPDIPPRKISLPTHKIFPWESEMPKEDSPPDGLIRPQERLPSLQALLDSASHLNALEEQWEKLKSFKTWALQNLPFKSRHFQFSIPGQITYNDYSLPKPQLLILSHSSTPSITTILRTLSALAMGTKITVCAGNHSSFIFWEEFLAPLKGRIPIATSIDQAPPDTILLLDAPLSQLQKLNLDSLIKILCDEDAPQDFESLCLEFVHIRTFAINTMRHGAPMEIDL